MKLLLKFSIIFTLIFGLGLAAAGYLSYRLLQDSAREQVIQQAQLMMEAMRSARAYTTQQVKPLLVTQQAHQRSFLPQTVPAYAATETFGYLRGRYADYEYKEAALNPTNPRDRATDWEADIINTLRNHPQQKEVTGERSAATGRSLFLARSIVADPPCLECHDLAKSAPPAMIRRYGSANGFGWLPGEIIGAQIVSVPMSVPLRMADRAFRDFFLALIAVFLVTLAILNLVMYFTVIRPVSQLSHMADRISLGDLEVPELPVRGSDEISVLADSFNRMRRSLIAALRMLDK